MSICISGPGAAGIPCEWKVLLQFRGYGKDHGNGLVGMTTLHFSISHPEKANKPIRNTYTIGKKTGNREKCPNLGICILNFIFSCFHTKNFHSFNFLCEFAGYLFHGVHGKQREGLRLKKTFAPLSS